MAWGQPTHLGPVQVKVSYIPIHTHGQFEDSKNRIEMTRIALLIDAQFSAENST